jgi:signal transduction histidine kinase
MLTLLATISETGDFRLPLCDASAMTLAVAVLERDVQQREATLVDALRVDPALAIWAALSCREANNQTTVKSLVEWLAPRLNDLLTANIAKAFDLSSEDRGRFAALAAESVRAASEVTRGLAKAESIAEPRYLSGLTFQFETWLVAPNVDQTFPTSSWPLERVEVPNDFVSESRVAGDEAWRRWLCEIPETQSLLPAIVSQSARLTLLEGDFERELQAAKLDSLKELAYGAGHELNNPLANIASRAQTLLKEEQHPERRRRLAAINTQAFRAHEMLADMMLFARPPELKIQTVDVATLANGVLAELADDAAEQQTQLHRVGLPKLVVEADPIQLRVALRALCINALEALASGGNVSIDLRQTTSIDENAVEIAVADDGPGISSEIRSKIFDPFFSGREAGRGLGFGLSKCWRIVQLHGGQIVVESQAGRGTTFTIHLPTKRDSTVPQQSELALP